MNPTPQTATTTATGAPIRRRFTKALPIALAATVALTGALGSFAANSAAAAPPASIAAQATGLKTTADLNLRGGPSTSDKVLLVIPSGGSVVDRGQSTNGFHAVSYNGTNGWASELYLTYDEPIPPHAGPVVGIAAATVDLNFRAAPNLGAQVQRVIPRGGLVDITETMVNGWRYVYYQGLGGWVADQYLGVAPGDGPIEPGQAIATADLNLRAQPSRSATVLLVIPEGGVVQLADGTSGEYREVIYNGTRGWAAYAYLN